MGDDGTMAAEREARIAREKTNSAVVVRPRAERYALLRAGDGKLLAASALSLSIQDYASDDVGGRAGRLQAPGTRCGVDLHRGGASRRDDRRRRSR
jgi:hypothetical protein